MTDDGGTTARTPDGLCPWCSSPVTGDPDVCPSCGASLRDQAEAIRATEPQIPGLTEVDPALVRKPLPAPRSRGLMAWLTGDTVEDASETKADPAALAPPDEAVRREMLRLKMDALKSQLESEAAAVELAAAEAAAERSGAPEVADDEESGNAPA